jgi:hypothetical protein
MKPFYAVKIYRRFDAFCALRLQIAQQKQNPIDAGFVALNFPADEAVPTPCSPIKLPNNHRHFKVDVAVAQYFMSCCAFNSSTNGPTADHHRYAKNRP